MSNFPARLIAAIALALFGADAGAREVVGVHGGWGAFRAVEPRRCWAQSATAPAAPGVFAAALFRPRGATGRPGSPQIHLRLGRSVRPGSAILLTIDGRPFGLVGRGVDAWAPGAAADRAIAAAMRTGVAMNVVARDARGIGFSHDWRLAGAASALDAAALACRT